MKRLKFFLLFITLLEFGWSGIEGKRVYGDNNLDKKVEKYSRHQENPYEKDSSTKKELQRLEAEVKKNQIIESTKKDTFETLDKNKKIEVDSGKMKDLKKESIKRNKISHKIQKKETKKRKYYNKTKRKKK